MKITYWGHSCVVVESGDRRVLIDPFWPAGLPESLGAGRTKIDLIVLTHGHSDHFGEHCIELAKKNDCPIAAVYELAAICQQLGAPRIHPMNVGGGYDFGFAHVRLTPALHSSSVEIDGQFRYAGVAAGVVLKMGGKTFYHAGDTALFGEFASIGRLYAPDIAALPIGDNFTMGPAEAVEAARMLNVGKVIPIHYNTFPPIRQDVDAFVRRLAEVGIEGLPLKAGESVEI
ncbi:MAG: metal-dependent hydrolase [Candidatus Reconcilbacillus cellulovorans]|uniref:UPF0173 metal-dependent hydrolase BLM47_09695 n=1 Tax=Candidatus Reconcilbacillus cellulovorans TaxID=1906605 RepID=A0A2A6DYM5_9BACL|nr:MAG: metal-dependent hydrolase [Candidatus Reconcilbacillus cellulovorans]